MTRLKLLHKINSSPKGPLLHSWNLTPKEAVKLQRRLAIEVIREDRFEPLRIVAGADLAFLDEKKSAVAGIVLFEFPSMKEVERVWAVDPVRFPYVPGLLSFREGPILMKAFEKLKRKPDLLFIDGHGLSHPRRMGIASHMGLVLDIPTVGCGKSRLCGEHSTPAKKRGSWVPLIHGGEEVGAVLRTREGVRPIYVSTGHRISLKSAIQIVMQCLSGFRIPTPTREADRFVAELKRRA